MLSIRLSVIIHHVLNRICYLLALFIYYHAIIYVQCSIHFDLYRRHSLTFRCIAMHFLLVWK